jgi:MoaA/NifB/PqqE/SkfB family radical SAM enzyme
MNKNFCPAPFTTLIINADGQTGCCREKGTEHSIGNALEEDIQEIWNGSAIQSWRREFLTGNIETCKKELHDMSCNLFKHNMELLPFVDYKEIQDKPIFRFSPDINGRCNLKCPMCIVWKKPNGKYDLKPDFWENLEANVLPHLKIMDPLSGEPFIQEDLYKIIRLTAKVNPECRWNFTTNGQWTMTDYIRKHLDMIRINLISISMDTVNHETYTNIRKGGDLQTLKRNIASLIEYTEEREKRTGQRIELILNFTIQKDNAYEMISMFDYSETVKLSPMMVFLYDPSKMSLEEWSDKEKVYFLKYYFERMNPRRLAISNRVFMAVIRSIKDETVKKRMFSVYNVMSEGLIGTIVKTSEDPVEYLKLMTPKSYEE